jgi:hypothetical protein
MAVERNLVLGCKRRVHFARTAGNRCDGNVYDAVGRSGGLSIEEPGRVARLGLASWREHLGFDRAGAELGRAVRVDLDGAAAQLSAACPLEGAPDDPAGPLATDAWRELVQGGTTRVALPAAP